MEMVFAGIWARDFCTPISASGFEGKVMAEMCAIDLIADMLSLDSRCCMDNIEFGVFSNSLRWDPVFWLKK
tara:strand:+ start:10205 stop:10417 length:213 start_codon:yes stop_codon:yes gene_type:complete